MVRLQKCMVFACLRREIAKSGFRMPKTHEESKREWRKAFWLIVSTFLGMLIACVVGLILFHGLPGGR
jgi:hypothetical protein